MWINLRFFYQALALGLLFFPSLLFGLTPEEIEDLRDLSREKLIETILIYDNNLTENESSWNEIEARFLSKEESLKKRELILNQRELSLSEKEKLLQTKESEINLRETLLAESFEMAKQRNKQSYWTGFTHGGLVLSVGTAIIMGFTPAPD